jgi:hypothetical protein
MAKKNKDPTLGELAAEWEKPLSELLLVAKKTLGKDGLNGHHRVTPNQSKQIKDSWDAALAAPRPSEPLKLAPMQSHNDAVTSFAIGDSRPEFNSLRFSDLGFKVWCHQDVYEGLEVRKHLSKRATMALRQIVAFGHTSVAKGCSDQANRGWLRSPLGGGNQNHFYLWWARQGSPALQGFPLGKDDIVVRSVRHHDEHEPLGTGNLSDYVSVEREKLGEGAREFESPWNQEQLLFINSDAPVRLAIGRPGSGKTTVLWQAVDLRTDQDVLYATWSQKLVDEAEKHFRAFAPTGTRIHTFDFAKLLGHICRQDIRRQPLQVAREEFEKLLPEDRTGKLYGPWANRTGALFAEIRAHLVGSVMIGEVERGVGSGPSQVLFDSYSKDKRVLERIGKEAVTALIDIAKEIDKVKSIVSLFPELDFASRAINNLKHATLPQGFSTITRIVVDEIQDLTLLELNVFLELSKAISRSRRQAPFMLLAGDEGQTVRPSGFEWGPVSDLISGQLKNPERFQLQASVRYPGRIAEVLEKASRLYGTVNKAHRPRRQSRVDPDDYRQAQVFHVALEDQVAGIELLRKLVEVDGLLVVTAGENVPEWIKKEVGDGVLTPVESKGLEYQSVCVINPGLELVSIGEPSKLSRDRLDNLYRRTQIDQLRVAMSRTTETLVFIDINATAAELICSRNLLDNPAPFEAADLIDLLTLPDITPEERVLNRIGAARTLVETRPARAWQLVVQALDMLGEPALHNGVTEPLLRKETVEVALSIASRLLAEGLPDGVAREDVMTVASGALERLESKEFRAAFDAFAEWLRGDVIDPFDLLDAISVIEETDNWLRSALSSKTQRLMADMEAGTKDIATAARFSGDVERWLEICGFAGGVAAKCTTLRRQAVDLLLTDLKARDAEAVLFKIDNINVKADAEDQIRIGRLRNIQDRWVDAAQAFELGDAHSDAIKSWRAAAKWEEARRVAQDGGIEDADLDWLLRIDAVVNATPTGLSDRLQEKERTRLAELRKRMQLAPTRIGK